MKTKYKILFNNNGPIPAKKISGHVNDFKESYTETVRKIIIETKDLNLDKNSFIKNTAILLNSFGMARSGPFKRIGVYKGKAKGPVHKLQECWDAINEELSLIMNLLKDQNLIPRSRTLVLLDNDSRNEVISYVWKAFKKLLPVTMGEHSYGLVGASKLLYSVLPEIVLPVDNSMWLNVFKTVDMGDVINTMANEIIEWEKMTGEQLQNCDYSSFTTLPAVYNVMAMAARPQVSEHEEK